MTAGTVPIDVTDEGLCFFRCLIAWDPSLDVVYFLSKPWKWQQEYDVWLEHGCPVDEHSARFDELMEAWDEL